MEKVGNSTRRVLNEIVQRCDSCKVYAQRPKRFKFELRADKDFNHTVYTEIFYIEGKPILHMVDESTRYQEGRWLESFSSEALWRSLRIFWIDVYIGPPDVIFHDAGKNFIEGSISVLS